MMNIKQFIESADKVAEEIAYLSTNVFSDEDTVMYLMEIGLDVDSEYCVLDFIKYLINNKLYN